MVIGDGKPMDFWHDAWCVVRTLCEQFPPLFLVNNQQNLTVIEMCDKNWNLTFRRWLEPMLQNQLGILRSQLFSVALNDTPDKPIWKYTKSGFFTVKSLYTNLSSMGVDRSFKHPWKAKLPLKIKIWLWLIWHNAIASKDNMKKRLGGEFLLPSLSCG
jgi:hypothetical protein